VHLFTWVFFLLLGCRMSIFIHRDWSAQTFMTSRPFVTVYAHHLLQLQEEEKEAGEQDGQADRQAAILKPHRRVDRKIALILNFFTREKI
jgi:hypothetical protein